MLVLSLTGRKRHSSTPAACINQYNPESITGLIDQSRRPDPVMLLVNIMYPLPEPEWNCFFWFEFRSVPVLALVSVLFSSTHSTENQIYSKNYCFLIGSASFDRFFDGSGRVWFGSARLDIWKVGSSPVKKVRVRVRSDSNRTELKRFDFGLCPLHDKKSLLFMFLGSKCPMLFCLLAKQK